MIQSQTTYRVTCDSCGEESVYEDCADWREFTESLKEDGWRSRKNDDQWEHFCNLCKY